MTTKRLGSQSQLREANNEYLATCRCVAPRGQGVVVLVVMVSSHEYGKQAFRTAQDQPFESQGVPGVGGDVQLDQVKPLALKALERLP